MIASPSRAALAGLILAALTACSSVAPKYTLVPENVNRLRDAGFEPTRLGDFNAAAKNGNDVNHLTIRGGTYQSPYDSSYVSYLREALRMELDEARLLNPNATVEVSGFLLRNELNAAGIATADAQIEARFVVKRDGQVRFDKVLTATHQWESSFMGNIAIPRAQQNYPTVIQKLLANLYADPDFIASMRK
jgi:hypothetical protein